MKYIVEFGGTVEVEADTAEQAEFAAWSELKLKDIAAVVAREE